MKERIYIRSVERFYRRWEFMNSLREYHRGVSNEARELICETTKMGVNTCIDEISNFGWEYVSCNKTDQILFDKAVMKSTYSVYADTYKGDDLAIVQVKFELSEKARGIPELFELQEDFFRKVYKFDTTDTTLEDIPKFPVWLKILIGVGVMSFTFNPYGGILALMISAFFIWKRRKKFSLQIKNNKEKKNIINEYNESMKSILKKARALLANN